MADLILNDAEESTPSSILESTWAGSSANSYVTLSEADDYITNYAIDSSVWTNSTSIKQEAAILQATQDIDSRQYIYDRYVSTQALEFPRRLTTDWGTGNVVWVQDSITAEEARMQEGVKRACALQALYLLRRAQLSSHTNLLEAGVLSMSRKVGPIEESYKYGSPSSKATGAQSLPGSSKHRLCPEALNAIAPWLTSKRIFRA